VRTIENLFCVYVSLLIGRWAVFAAQFGVQLDAVFIDDKDDKDAVQNPSAVDEAEGTSSSEKKAKK
jgi:hypothetical protein